MPSRCGARRLAPRNLLVTLLSLLTVLAVLAPPAGTAGADATDTDRPFRDGTWAGTLAATGVVVGRFPDADATMLTSMSGSFDAGVVGGEVVGGTWTLSGASDGVLLTDFGQGDVSNIYAGAGPVGGDASSLELGGAVDTTWQVSIGGSTDTSQDPIQLGPFEVEVFHLDCNSLVGLWEHAFAAEVADAGGWEATLSGSFQASHLGDDPAAGLVDLVDSVTEEAHALLEDLTAAASAGPPLTIDDPLRQRFRGLIATANTVEVLIAEQGAAAECLFPATAGTFGLMITSTVQAAAQVLLSEGALDAAGLEFLAEQLVAVGGAGLPALPNPRVAELEELVAGQVSELLTDAAITDPVLADDAGCTAGLPCLPAEPHVISALRAAELLHLAVTIDGQRYEWADVHVWLILAQLPEVP